MTELNLKRIDRWVSWLVGVATVLFLAYVVDGFGPRFFSETCTHNDLRQQGFPFYRVNHPEMFANDFVFESMNGYLPPLHSALGLLFTYPTDNPVLTGHILMSVQLSVTVLGIFGALRGVAGFIPACVGVVLFINSAPLILLLSGGLARGWIGPVIAIYLWLAVRSRGRGLGVKAEGEVWSWLLVSALLNPVATFLILSMESLRSVTRFISSSARWAFFRSSMLPFGGVALAVVIATSLITARPPEIGKMATLAVASNLQGFSRPGGRFAVLPFPEPWIEFKTLALQLFTGFWSDLAQWKQQVVGPLFFIAVIAVVLVTVVRLRRGRKVSESVVPEFLGFGCVILGCYFLARAVAFALYIPDRYFGMPAGVFFAVFVPSFLWLVTSATNGASLGAIRGLGLRYGAQLMLVLATFAFGGFGARGPELFDVCYQRQEALWDFLKLKTSADAVIAGHPTTLDGVQLFGRRIGYVTTETAHPFYDRYYAEVKRRMEVTFSAHYAQDWRGFHTLLSREGIDYFVFRVGDFAPERLHRERYEIPFQNMIKRLNSFPREAFVFSALPQEVDSEQAPFQVLRTNNMAVVDIKALGQWLATAATR